MTVSKYIQTKYSAGGPGSGRFEPDASEVHASQLSDCQRKRYWKHKRAHRADPSVYFELGRVFELLYGAALAFEHDPSTTERTLKRYPPWEVAERAVRVQQDVGVTIELDADTDIVGECDWVVFRDDRTFEHLHVCRDGSREAEVDGELVEYEGGAVEKVVETKTKGDLKWVRSGPDKKHLYQVYPYVHALDCDGEVAYMQRDDFEELTFDVDYDEDVWLDCVARALAHSRNMSGDELPPTTPMGESECRFCPFSDECRAEGGSAW